MAYQIGVPSYEMLTEQASGETYGSEGMYAHQGDPCLWCDQAADDVAPGPCPGKVAFVNVLVYKQARRGKAEAGLPWDEIMARAKEAVAQALEDLPEHRFTSDDGSAYVPADGVSVRYDASALDRLCAANPELGRILSPYRTERVRKGSLTIR